jgi:hypothetical protein
VLENILRPVEEYFEPLSRQDNEDDSPKLDVRRIGNERSSRCSVSGEIVGPESLRIFV